MTPGMVKGRTWQLLGLLADGEFHSGEALANQLGMSRASVFNALSDVADCGVVLQRIRGRGYRLARPWQRLEREEILRWLGKDAKNFNIEILLQATSSNTLLLQRVSAGVANGDDRCASVLAVELQTAGRGRMGKVWYSGLGTALTFSLAWRFDRGLNELSGLSLAAAVAIVRALSKLGAQGVKLKWPNDILTTQGKLAGVLVEAHGDVLGPSDVVIGVGLNCTLSASMVSRIGQSACALDEVCAEMPSRNRLLAMLLLELAPVLQQFEKSGFASLHEEWERYHFHQNLPIQINMGNEQIVSGIARGVSDIGEICLETAQGVRRFNSGEVGIQFR
jgi:BirA family biotin operon repressor/biotin-[acetyl-CoA-carboxylase] ligase